MTVKIDNLFETDTPVFLLKDLTTRALEPRSMPWLVSY